jgi:hypothetical protein
MAAARIVSIHQLKYTYHLILVFVGVCYYSTYFEHNRNISIISSLITIFHVLLDSSVCWRLLVVTF